MRTCALIPSYQHVEALPALARVLRARVDAVFIIDDGNKEPERIAIAALHAPESGIEVLRLDVNSGKGAAMLAGFRHAIERKFSHALQIDADGQHDVSDIAKFLAAMQENADAVICGRAQYDESVPKSRKIGRNITHFWVWIETFSFDIANSMCGFRVYPLSRVAPVIRKNTIGARMDFDTEIVVHLHWRGARIVNVPTRVIYPPGNISNFDMLADNVRISLMHTRLALQAPFRVLWKLVAFR